MAKILVVEDDRELSEKLKQWLNWERHVVDVANSGDDGWYMLQQYEYEIVILDWNLPGLTGYEVLKKYRANGGNAPVLMLTGMDQIEDKEQGFDAGADDYVTKPFNTRELSARIRALLRRPSDVYPQALTVGNLSLDSRAIKVTKEGKEIQLQPKEFALLEHLMRHPNKVFSSKSLLETL